MVVRAFRVVIAGTGIFCKAELESETYDLPLFRLISVLLSCLVPVVSSIGIGFDDRLRWFSIVSLHWNVSCVSNEYSCCFSESLSPVVSSIGIVFGFLLCHYIGTYLAYLMSIFVVFSESLSLSASDNLVLSSLIILSRSIITLFFSSMILNSSFTIDSVLRS